MLSRHRGSRECPRLEDGKASLLARLERIVRGDAFEHLPAGSRLSLICAVCDKSSNARAHRNSTSRFTPPIRSAAYSRCASHRVCSVRRAVVGECEHRRSARGRLAKSVGADRHETVGVCFAHVGGAQHSSCCCVLTTCMSASSCRFQLVISRGRHFFDAAPLADGAGVRPVALDYR